MKILCVGMMICDTILSPVPKEIMQMDAAAINRPVMSCGGDALNTAVGLGKLSCDVTVCGKIGDDASGRFLLQECARYGVKTDAVVIDAGMPTSDSFALIDAHGERHFLTERTMFHSFSFKDIDPAHIRAADIVCVGSCMCMDHMDEGGIENIFRIAHESGAVTVMDAALADRPESDWMRVLGGAFRETDIFFPSMQEAHEITGSDTPEEIAEAFRPFGMKLFGIKLGERGCFATDFSEARYIDCPHDFPVVNTSGAGDAFMAGLVCALSHGMNLFECVKFGTVIGSMNVASEATSGGIPSFSEAEAYFRKL